MAQLKSTLIAGDLVVTDKINGALNSAAIGSGDHLVFSDASDGNRMRQATITFGSSATQCLANNGTWQSFTTASGNDYAEYRKSRFDIEPGRVVYDDYNGYIFESTERLIPGAQVVSDTYAYLIGEEENIHVPIAVAGRVLVYTYQPRENYHPGMAVCSAPDGTVDIMTREEIRDYPDCIVGIVSEIPNYEEWGSGHVKVNGRIWIKVK